MQWLLAALTLQTVSCIDLKAPEWISFKAKYNRTYATPAEEVLRLNIFTTNLRRIEEHNAGGSSFRLGINALADLAATEYLALLTPARLTDGDDAPFFSPLSSSLPGLVPSSAGSTKDWRDEGAVTSVKSIGSSCGGASWAFAAAAAVESAWQIAGNPLVKLSEQQLIDCSGDYGTGGCESGLPQQAFEYLMHSAGLSSSNHYPYQQDDWYECRARPSTSLAIVSNWMRTTRGSEVELEYVVANIGPVSARVDASHTSFELYSGGVYDQRACSTSDLNLAVEIVGYGTETIYGQEIAYWLVKNAWGPGWGEYGYIKIRKDAQNMCGIATDVTYPVV